MLPKTIAYIKSFYGQTKWMFFFIEDDLLEKCNTIWDKVGAVIKKNLMSLMQNRCFLINT